MGSDSFTDGRAKGSRIDDFFGASKQPIAAVNSAALATSITNLQHVKASYPVQFKASSSSLLLIVVDAPEPVERGANGLTVSNIVLQDKCGTEVRMALWNDETRHQSTFLSNLGKEILLSNVTLRPVSGEGRKFLPDPAFSHELSVVGKLHLMAVGSPIPRFDRLRDLRDKSGLMKGILQLRVGKGAEIHRLRGRDYKVFGFHDGRNRIMIHFASAIDTSKLRKSSEAVVKKLRLTRKPGDPRTLVCLVEYIGDFNLVKSSLRTIPDVEFNALPDIFGDGGGTGH